MFDVTCLDAYGNVVTNLTQWDTDQSLIITDSGLVAAPEFHFCNKNSKEALVVPSTIADGTITVKIPNILLQEGTTIIAYIYAYTSTTSGKTLATIRIPVRPRPEPSDYEYVENIEYVSAVALEQSVAAELERLSADNESFKTAMNADYETITTSLADNYEETITNLNTNYENTLTNLDVKYTEAINLLLSKVTDGTPKGVFADESELADLESGVYLNTTDGWIYFWDGTTLSEGICQYQSTGIADGSITNAHLGEIISIEKGGTGASEAAQALYNLGALPYKEIFFDEIDSRAYPIAFYDGTDHLTGDVYYNAPFAYATILSVAFHGVTLGGSSVDFQIAISHDDGSIYMRTASWIDALSEEDGLLKTPWTKVDNDKIFNNMDDANAYLTSDFAKAGQIIKVNESGIYQVYIIQESETSESGYDLSAINAEITAVDVPFTDEENITDEDDITNVDAALKRLNALYNTIQKALNENVAVDLDYNEVDNELALLNSIGAQIGNAITILSSGVSGITLDTVTDDNDNYYLVIYDEAGEELTRTLLPATGGGGGSAYLIRLINKMGATKFSVASNNSTVLKFDYYELYGEESTGVDGELEVFYKLSTESEFISAGTRQVSQGENIEVDVTELLSAGNTTNIKITVTGAESQLSKSITFTITSVDLYLTTTFDSSVAYSGNISFLYRCFGRGLSKTVYFYIDEEKYAEVDVGTSHNVQLEQLISINTHGSHKLDVYFITSDGTESSHLIYDVMYTTGDTTPIISCVTDITSVNYGETIVIDYYTYTEGSDFTDEVLLSIYTLDDDGNRVEYSSTLQKDVTNQTKQTWIVQNYPTEGTMYLELSSGDTVKTLPIDIIPLETDFELNPVETRLVYAFSPAGHSNNDANKETFAYTYLDKNNVTTDIKASLSGFDYASNGWVATSENKSVLRHSGDAVTTINLPIFSASYVDEESQTVQLAGTAQNAGRTIEFEFNVHDVVDYDTEIIRCFDEDTGTGFVFTPTDAYLLASTLSIAKDSEGNITNKDNIPIVTYRDNERLRVSFVIEPVGTFSDDTGNKQKISAYINGEFSSATPYDDASSFTNSQIITMGSEKCILDIYSIRMYDMALTETQIKQNYFADKETIQEKIALNEENDVLDDFGNETVDYYKCIKKYPCILWTGKLSAYKGDKTKGGIIFTKPADNEDGYTEEMYCMDMLDGKYVCQSNVQGTSSQRYAKKNYKFTFSKVFDAEDEETGEKIKESRKVKYKLKGDDSIGESTLCYKIDYMSPGHENTYNANMGSMQFEELVPPQVVDSKVQVAIYGYRCLLFVRETEDSEIIFEGDGCLNNDKGNSATFGLENDGDLPEDASGNIISNYTKSQKWEFLDNSEDICNFKTDKLLELRTEGEKQTYAVLSALESSYPDQGDLEEAGLLPNYDNIQILFTWVCQRANFWTASKDTLASPIEYNGVSYNTEYDYKFAVFTNEFTKHFNENHALTYYLFVEYVALVDNRAKNMFLSCYDTTTENIVFTDSSITSLSQIIDSTTGEVDCDKIDWENSTFATWYLSLYDLDSCMGVENSGYNVVPYYAEWDYVYNNQKIFNGADSYLHRMLEAAFPSKLTALYKKLRDTNKTLGYDVFYQEHITKGADAVCTAIVNQDRQFKYVDIWTDGYMKYSDDNSTQSLVKTSDYMYLVQGKKYQKMDFMYKRGTMLDSKYVSAAFTNNKIDFRIGRSTTTGDEATLTIKPAITMYPRAEYGNSGNYLGGKTFANEEITITPPDGDYADILLQIYGASFLSSIGDISHLYPYSLDVSSATRLQELIIGSDAEGYENTRLTSLTPTACTLLKKINVQNCSALTGTLNLLSCGLIEEVYADGSGLSAISLPVGGYLKKLHLPSTLTNLTIREHSSIEEFSCAGYDKIRTLWLDNVGDIVPTDDILKTYASQLRRIRLVDVNWNLEDSSLLELLISDTMKGKRLDANGNEVDDTSAYPYISGTVTIKRINAGLKTKLEAAYPDLKINNEILTYTVTFYSDTNIVHEVQEIDENFPAVAPLVEPTKKADAQYKYQFVSWDKTFTKIVKNLDVYALYSKTTQTYNVAFYETVLSTTPLQSFTDVEYNDQVSYTGKVLSSTEDSICVGWQTSNGNVYTFNTIRVDDTICSVDDNGNPNDIAIYGSYQAVAMPTKSVTSASELSFGELKAVSNMIVKGGDNTWVVTYYESENQYLLTNATDGVSVMITLGDKISILLSNNIEVAWQIYDFKHDVDENGNYVGMTFGMENIYTTRQMNPSFKHTFNYNLGGTDYVNDNKNYSSSTDETDSPIHTVTAAEGANGYVELKIKDRTYLRNITVTDAGGTSTKWWFDQNGYYCGSDSETYSKATWYMSDYATNTYKIGKAIYNTTGKNGDGGIIQNQNVTPAGFGSMVIDTTASGAYVKQYCDTTNFNNYAFFTEMTAGTIIKIPVAYGDTVKVNAWSYSRNAGGYSRTALRDYVNNTFTPLLPIGWQSAITPVVKKSTIGNRSTVLTTTCDKLFLFSGTEVGTVTSAPYNTEGKLYPIFSDNASRIKYKSDGSAYHWWLRSPYVSISYGTYYFLYVSTSGAYNPNTAYNTYGVVLGFGI